MVEAMIAKTASERMQKSRDIKRASGFVLRHVWIHPRDWKRAKAYIERLAAKRKESES